MPFYRVKWQFMRRDGLDHDSLRTDDRAEAKALFDRFVARIDAGAVGAVMLCESGFEIGYRASPGYVWESRAGHEEARR